MENPGGAKGQGGQARCGRKGSPATSLPAGSRLTLAQVEGSGTVRRMWLVFWNRSPEQMRGIRIEMYWDGADTPAVQAPLADFFCHPHGHMVRFENALFSSPEARTFNCCVPMPFRKGARVELVNDTGADNHVYYEVDATLGDVHSAETLYFHAHWRRENLTTLRQDMTILPRVTGRGRFIGTCLSVRLHPSMRNFWWGEGEVKVYLDGDADHPTLVGTGTEDYIGTGYGQGLFANLYQGNHYLSEPANEFGAHDAYGFYRLHIPDPVYFHRDVRVTIQVMGGPSYRQMLDALDRDPGIRFMKAGDGSEYYSREELEADPQRAEVMERVDDHSAMAWFYLDRPENGLPGLQSLAERTADLPPVGSAPSD
jgi:hypothetical protein